MSEPEEVAVAEEERRQISADYNAVFGTQQGQRVLNHLFTHVLRTNMVAGVGDGYRASYILAMHDVAAYVSQIMNMDFTQRRVMTAARPHPRFSQRQ